MFLSMKKISIRTYHLGPVRTTCRAIERLEQPSFISYYDVSCHLQPHLADRPVLQAIFNEMWRQNVCHIVFYDGLRSKSPGSSGLSTPRDATNATSPWMYDRSRHSSYKDYVVVDYPKIAAIASGDDGERENRRYIKLVRQVSWMYRVLRIHQTSKQSKKTGYWTRFLSTFYSVTHPWTDER